METLLQFGHGMMALSKDLIKKWNKGVVILSPRDLEVEQMEKFTDSLHENGGGVIVDPQFYMPRADHYRLTAHSFWPQDYDSAFFHRESVKQMLISLKNDYNDKLNSQFFLLPGIKTTVVNDDWYEFQRMLIEVAKEIEKEKEIYITLCLSKELMCNENDLHDILEYLDTLEFEGCYLVPEPVGDSYLIQDPNWLVNLMDITAGIKLQFKKVIIGYSNHQHLILALAKADGIASGSWLNTRSFKTKKFDNPESSNSRRSKWYYCPQAFSEYQIPFLDLAKRQGLLGSLESPKAFKANYSSVLFSGAQPSSVNYKERNSFAHYLDCLKFHTENSIKSSYDLTKNSLIMEIETARALTEEFKSNGVIGRDRDFGNVADINLAAISAFNSMRGLAMNFNWDKI